MSDLSLELNQLDLDIEIFRTEVKALKNELSEVRIQAAIATESFRLLLAKLGYSKSVAENILTIARRKVENAKIP